MVEATTVLFTMASIWGLGLTLFYAYLAIFEPGKKQFTQDEWEEDQRKRGNIK